MSGMRPTGRLHMGHWLGVLKNWVALQSQSDCYFMVADWHALTTQWEDTSNIRANIREVVLDWLAAGVDPAHCHLYIQSDIPEIAQLHLLLSMMTPVKWVETDPTLKDMVALQKSGEEDGLHYGLLGYPILQTADILLMKGTHVPIGRDQEAHLEISRDLARRFNHVVGRVVFPEPRPLFTEVSRLIGLDGRKMGKSFNNAIYLSDSEDETAAKVKTAVTDPQRVKRTDPGDPLACTAVYPYYELFADTAERETVAGECRQAARGCMDCKKQLAERINEHLRPLRERRKIYENDPAQLDALIQKGNAGARETAAITLAEARAALSI